MNRMTREHARSSTYSTVSRLLSSHDVHQDQVEDGQHGDRAHEDLVADVLQLVPFLLWACRPGATRGGSCAHAGARHASPGITPRGWTAPARAPRRRSRAGGGPRRRRGPCRSRPIGPRAARAPRPAAARPVTTHCAPASSAAAVGVGLQVEPPGRLGGVPPVHRQGDEVRPVLDVPEDDVARLPGAPPGGGQPQGAPAAFVGRHSPSRPRVTRNSARCSCQNRRMNHRGGSRGGRCWSSVMMLPSRPGARRAGPSILLRSTSRGPPVPLWRRTPPPRRGPGEERRMRSRLARFVLWATRWTAVGEVPRRGCSSAHRTRPTGTS